MCVVFCYVVTQTISAVVAGARVFLWRHVLSFGDVFIAHTPVRTSGTHKSAPAVWVIVTNFIVFVMVEEWGETNLSIRGPPWSLFPCFSYPKYMLFQYRDPTHKCS